MRRKHRGMTTVRQPMMVSRIKRSNLWVRLKIIILIAAVCAGVLAVIFFGFPLVEDLIKGVDPSLRYQPKVETEFKEEESGGAPKSISSGELYFDRKYRMKNEPYIDGNNIIFTTHVEEGDTVPLDGVIVYNTESGEARVLPNIERKYDNLVSPMLSGNIAVFVDSMTNGGGRILGYDLEKEEQFVIKEYAYALPQMSISGDRLAFFQWAGDATQRLYLYDLVTREPATVKLYENTTGNSGVDISLTDMVWGESDGSGGSVLKRIVFSEDGTSKYEYNDFGNAVYNPKTNGNSIVFSTEPYSVSGVLMMSTDGAEPVKIADGVYEYGIGDDFVVYSKNEQIYVAYTNAPDVIQLTGDVTKNLLASANGNGVCYYDLTDKSGDSAVIDEVVKYAYVPAI